jgi:60 kDa SS-A/Ro ribonucleoprotein
MAKNYLAGVLNPLSVPQSEPLPGKEMVANNAGGYVFSISTMKQVERFLILGSEGGSYYVTERKMTLGNVNALKAALAADGPAVVRLIVDISTKGRAPKNDSALFALALAASPKFADARTNSMALAALPQVARTGTHLFQFVNFVEGNKLRGWGRGLRAAVADWYLSKTPDKLAYQAVKYQNREQWSHRDLLRLVHANNPALQNVFHWIVKGEIEGPVPAFIEAFEKAKVSTDPKEIISLIESANLTREMIPTQFLNDVAVWDALLQKMPLTAMVRNLGKMTQVGLIKPLSDASALVSGRLRNQEWLNRARVHPIALLMAASTYESGRGLRGSLTWEAVKPVVDALDEAFYLAFDNIVPTGKRFYLGIDVSGSMGMGRVAGTALTPRAGAAAMAMVTARRESNYYMAGFQDKMVPLDIGARDRLPDVIRKTDNLPFGATDCAQPMIDALKKKLEADVFIVYTDNETWAGPKHPTAALQEYREKMGINSKLIVCGLTATGFSIADPSDPGMLDVVGFDTSVPQVISSFVGGGEMPEEQEVEAE